MASLTQPPGRLRARQIGPDDALADYLEKAGLGAVSQTAFQDRGDGGGLDRGPWDSGIF